MKTFLQSRSVLVLNVLNSVLTSLITYIGFLNPDPQIQFLSMGNMIIVLKVIAVGVFTFTILSIVVIMIRKIIEEKNDDIYKSLLVVYQRLLIKEAATHYRFHFIYPLHPSHDGSGRLINTDEQVKAEITYLRETFRVNRDKYNVPLDIVEDELKRTYAEHYF